MNDSELREALDTIFDILGGMVVLLKSIESTVKENDKPVQDAASHEQTEACRLLSARR
jgi:hypothetical protein